MQFKKQGGEFYASCPFHQEGKRPNFRVNIAKNSWFCDVCGEGGGVVEFLAKKQNRSKKEVFKELAQKNNPMPLSPPAPSPPAPKGEIVATYDYHDRFGNLVYQVCRLVPKTFRQRRPDGKGGWVWNMEGVERVLYRLPEILKNKWVWVVEGEKDVETLRSVGLCATCNVGGAGKWMDAYTESLKGKEVVVCGDNDEPGRKHVEKVIQSIEKTAASVRRIELPSEFKDVSDLKVAFPDAQQFGVKLGELTAAAPVMIGGGILPVKSMSELEGEYRESLRTSKDRMVELHRWIPSLRCVRPLVGGELVALVGDTGTAKTYVLQHLAMCCQVVTLLFEMELPGSLTFERFVGIANRKTGAEVAGIYSDGNQVDHGNLAHVYTCTKAGLSPDELESIILRSELKIGVRPTLVLVDYIQLIKGIGRSRYEQISSVAERLKVIAKNTDTVIVMASQVGRDKDDPEIRLHDAKDSGSIENSAGVVIGIWRDENESSVLNLRVLKNTKGRPSEIIPCQLDLGGSMRIVERSKIDEEDIPVR